MKLSLSEYVYGIMGGLGGGFWGYKYQLTKKWLSKREKSGSDRNSHGRRECGKCDGNEAMQLGCLTQREKRENGVRRDWRDRGIYKTTQTLIRCVINCHFILWAIRNHENVLSWGKEVMWLELHVWLDPFGHNMGHALDLEKHRFVKPMLGSSGSCPGQTP